MAPAFLLYLQRGSQPGSGLLSPQIGESLQWKFGHCDFHSISNEEYKWAIRDRRPGGCCHGRAGRMHPASGQVVSAGQAIRQINEGAPSLSVRFLGEAGRGF
jgi:hypothetical protein